MTWNTSTNPASSSKIRNFPGDVKANMWDRLQAIISADHQFNLSAASNDGYHKVARWVNQAGAYGDNTPAAIATTGQLYTKTINSQQHIFGRVGSATSKNAEVCLSFMPIRAACSFDATGAIVGTKFNVTSVTRNSLGDFTVNVNTGTANGLPSINPIIIVQAVRNSAGQAPLSAHVKNSTSWGTTQIDIGVNPNVVNVVFVDGSGNLEDPLRAFFILFDGAMT